MRRLVISSGIAVLCTIIGTMTPSGAAQSSDPVVNQTDEMVRLGIAKANSGDLNQAIKLFNASLAKSKNNVPALYNRGKVFLLEGQSDLAKRDLDQAIKLAPELGGAYVARAMLYRLNGDFTKALKDLDFALKIRSENTEALFSRAALLFDMGQYEKALDDLNAVVKINPRMIKAIGNRAYILEQLGRYDEAVKDLGAVIARTPDHLPAIKHMGFIYKQKGEPKKALKWYQMALEHEQNSERRKRLQEEIAEMERRAKSQ